MKCCVVKCKSVYTGKGCECSFFHFPSEPATRKIWIKLSGRRKECITKHSYICMHHFQREDFANNVQFELGYVDRRQLKEGVVPSIRTPTFGNVELYKKRAARIEKREQKKIVASLLKEYTPPVSKSVQDVGTHTTQQFEKPSEVAEFLDESLKGENPKCCVVFPKEKPSETAEYLDESFKDVEVDVDTLQALEEPYISLKQDTTQPLAEPYIAAEYLDEYLAEVNNENIPHSLERSNVPNDILKIELELLRMENTNLKRRNRKYSAELQTVKDQFRKVNRNHKYNMAKALNEIKMLREKLRYT